MRKVDGVVLVMLSSTRDSPNETANFVSGSDVHAFHFLKYCDRAGVQADVITNSYGAKLLQGKVQSRIHVVGLPRQIEINRKFDVIKSYLALPLMSLGLIVRFRNRAVVGASCLLPDAMITSFAGLMRRPTWVYFHHWSGAGHYNIFPKILQFVSVLVLRACSVEFFALPSNVEYMKKLIGEKRVRQFENGVEREALRKRGVFRSDVDVLYLGRVSAKKGSEDLVRIWEAAVKIDGTRRLTIAGSIEDPRFLAKLSQSAAAKNVVVLGQVSEQEKADLFMSAKCFISPSHEEGWGISVSEALEAGLPVVAYNIPAYAYEGLGIIRIPMGDVYRFATAALSARKGARRGTAIKDWDQVIGSDMTEIMNQM